MIPPADEPTQTFDPGGLEKAETVQRQQQHSPSPVAPTPSSSSSSTSNSFGILPYVTLAAVAVVASVGKAVASSAQTRALRDEPSLKFSQFLRQLHYTEQLRLYPFEGSAHLLSSNAKRDLMRVLVEVILNAEQGKLFADVKALLDSGASISAINKKFTTSIVSIL